MLRGDVKNATTGLLGFDANTILTLDTAKKFYAAGYRFCLRYISREIEPVYDLQPTEAENILDAGLALMPVQHVRKGYWVANGELGTQDGTAAAQNAKLVGFPPGVNVWCDLEAVDPKCTAADVVFYCNNWAAAVSVAGYLPGLYVGYEAILNSADLKALNFKSFWKSQSNVPNVGSIGFQMIQLYPETLINGIKVDFDITQSDFKNNQVSWLVRK